MNVPAPHRLWYDLTPARLVMSLLVAEAILFVIDYFRLLGIGAGDGFPLLVMPVLAFIGILWLMVRLEIRRDSRDEPPAEGGGVDESPPKHVVWPQFTLQTLMVAVAAVAIVCSYVAWYNNRIVAPRRCCDEIRHIIESLATRRPPNVTVGQWEAALFWTENLHVSSMLSHEARLSELRKLRDDMREKVAGEVDMDTILWIWDRYAQTTPHGKSYNRHARGRVLE
jgi:hypothetical protein